MNTSGTQSPGSGRPTDKWIERLPPITRVAGLVGVGSLFIALSLWLIQGIGGLWFRGGAELSIRRDVDPSAFLSVGVTLLVGFLLSQYMVLWSGDLKVERDVIVAQTDAIREAVDVLRDALIVGDKTPDEAHAAVLLAGQNALSEASLLQEILSQCRSERPPAADALRAAVRELWDLCGQVPVTDLTQDQRAEIDRCRRRVRRHLALVELQAAKRLRA